jgi:transcriptional regulator with XRE-family HTH domain
VDKVLERLRDEFTTEASRYAYADAVTNTFLTAQIKTLQEERGLTQEKLAELVGTQQSGISRWLNTGFATCKIESLRKFSKAFGVRLRVSFEEFGTLPADVHGFTKERLAPKKFEDDLSFREASIEKPRSARTRKVRSPRGTSFYKRATSKKRTRKQLQFNFDQSYVRGEHGAGETSKAA